MESVVGDRIAVYCVLRPKNKMLMSSTSWIPGNRTTRAAGFPKNVRPEQDFLKLVNVQRENAGQYKCTLIASDNSRQTIVITLFVREPGNLAQLNVNTTMLTTTLTSSSVTETETFWNTQAASSSTECARRRSLSSSRIRPIDPGAQ